VTDDGKVIDVTLKNAGGPSYFGVPFTWEELEAITAFPALDVVQEKKGRKVFSRGVWAPAATIERIRADLDERSTESFAKKKEADARRRDKSQAEYVEDFLGA
jgi:hypothetical protein